MTQLLDADTLIALSVVDHVHHETVEEWFASQTEAFATCPITQGALMRFLVRGGASARQAAGVVADRAEHPRHEFWPDDLTYAEVSLVGVVGHRQLTDAYLAGLARARGGTLTTLDRGLAALHRDVAMLVDAPASQRSQ